jgi:phosphoribosylformylglycinamidine (FGAM) synthase PurS component
MALNARLRGVMDWLLEGYPGGVPPKDYIPLIALLRRRLTDDEVAAIAHEISELGYDEVQPVDIGVSISKITDALPSEEDVARVERQLYQHHDWPAEAS